MFKFGYLGTLEQVVFIKAFISVICFLIFIETMIGILEYFLSNLPIYNKMIQKIYKELMIMGLFSFIISTYLSTIGDNMKEDEYNFIEAIEYSHIVLFYVAIYFVLHAFFIMYSTWGICRKYAITAAKPIEIIIKNLEEINSNWLFSSIYSNKYFPFDSIRDDVEFKLLNLIFLDTYYLIPEDFNFSSYLTSCIQRYSLKLTDIGITSWIFVIFLAVLNYLRIEFKGPFNCGHHKDTGYSSSGGHRLLSIDGDSSDPYGCYYEQLRFFAFAEFFLFVFVFILYFFARKYELSLISMAATINDKDDIHLLKFFSDNLQRKKEKNSIKEFMIATFPTDEKIEQFNLKQFVQEVLDEQESTNTVENPLHKYLGDIILKFFSLFNEFKFWLITKAKISFRKLFNYLKQSNKIQKEISNRIIVQEFHQSVHKNQDNNTYNRKSLFKAPTVSNLNGKIIKNSVAPTISEDNLKKSQEILPNRSTSRRKSIIECAQATSVVAKRRNSLIKAGIPSDKVENKSVERRASIVEKMIHMQQTLEEPVLTKFHNYRHASISSDDSSVVDSTTNSVTMMKTLSKNLSNISLSGNNKTRSTKSLDKSFKRSLKFANPNRTNETEDKTKSSQSEIGNIEESFVEQLEEIDLNRIFLFNNPNFFYFAVDIGLMFNCLYMSIWSSNFISLVQKFTIEKTMWQFLMILPFIIVVPILLQIIKKCSTIEAIIELNLDAMNEVLENEEDTKNIVAEFRDKIQTLLTSFRPDEMLTIHGRKQIMLELFEEIDKDDSGNIEKIEFRFVLKALNLLYSDKRFELLFSFADKNFENRLNLQEMTNLVFHPYQMVDMDNMNLSHSDSLRFRNTSFSIESNSDSDEVSIGTSKNSSKIKKRRTNSIQEESDDDDEEEEENDNRAVQQLVIPYDDKPSDTRISIIVGK